jgi:hypothetical protein
MPGVTNTTASELMQEKQFYIPFVRQINQLPFSLPLQ